MKENLWFKFADEDMRMAETALEEGIYNQVCFHCQQASEKFLKGYLYRHHRDIPRTHLLDELLKECRQIDQSFKKLTDHCGELDDYYIPTRYPDALPGSLPEGLPNEKDAQEALILAQRIKKFVRERITKGAD